jgi:hypothetical protein
METIGSRLEASRCGLRADCSHPEPGRSMPTRCPRAVNLDGVAPMGLCYLVAPNFFPMMFHCIISSFIKSQITFIYDRANDNANLLVQSFARTENGKRLVLSP